METNFVVKANMDDDMDMDVTVILNDESVLGYDKSIEALAILSDC